MTDPQVLLDARGATDQDLCAGLGTLLAQVPVVEVVHLPGERLERLSARFGGRVRAAGDLRRDVPVLVTSGRVCWAVGAVRRALRELAVPGRRLTRVLVHELPSGQGQVACWAPSWLGGFTGTLEELVDADPAFDRAHLPRASSSARAWVRADAIGVAVTSELGEDERRWARRVGAVLAGREAVAAVRGPLGAGRRRLRRWRQRRAARPVA